MRIRIFLTLDLGWKKCVYDLALDPFELFASNSDRDALQYSPQFRIRVRQFSSVRIRMRRSCTGT